MIPSDVHIQFKYLQFPVKSFLNYKHFNKLQGQTFKTEGTDYEFRWFFKYYVHTYRKIDVQKPKIEQDH